MTDIRIERIYEPIASQNTFVVTYNKLNVFEDDLHRHVHLENNILFLKASQL